MKTNEQNISKITPESLKNHVEGLNNRMIKTPHSEILDKLLEQLEPIDFELLAFPNLKNLRNELHGIDPDSEEGIKIRRKVDKMKINLKHYIVLSIENIFSVAQKNNFGLCKKFDSVYIYNGAWWAKIEKDEFQNFLGQASLKMGVPKFSAKFYKFKEELYKQFLATAYLSKSESNKEDVLINLKNGTFLISPKGVVLRPFNSLDFITYQLNFEFDPKAKAPLFESFLNKVLPDKSLQRILAEYIGYVFIKNGHDGLKLEKALILYGKGQNGKSVVFEIVMALLGKSNVTNYSIQSLTEEKGYYRAGIVDKLLNYASEISGRMEPSIFKALVSGETIEACQKYGQPYSMSDYAKLMFNCNELPKDVEQTDAFFRRFIILPFFVSIKDDEKDPELAKKIVDNELSGIFNWVLDGLKRLLEQKKFTESEIAKNVLFEYRKQSDSVQMFVEENDYQISVVQQIPLKAIYIEYKNYCIESGFKSCSRPKFVERMRNMGYEKERKSIGYVINAIKKFF